jgi:hypothetical protein
MLTPRFSITNRITAGLTQIERARGFLDAATLSETWVERMSQRAVLLEAHHTTHIEGTQLTLTQAERLWGRRRCGRSTKGRCTRVAELPRSPLPFRQPPNAPARPEEVAGKRVDSGGRFRSHRSESSLCAHN